MTCSECTYWKLGDAENREGTCRIIPPVIGTGKITRFPETDGNYWCGQFKSHNKIDLTCEIVQEIIQEFRDGHRDRLHEIVDVIRLEMS